MGSLEYHRAEINVARMRAPLTDPVMADFVAQLDAVNALADRSPGFVWRLQSEHLHRHGPTAHAFTFKARFPKPGLQESGAIGQGSGLQSEG